MQRLLARLLLVFVLVGTLAPVGLAVAVPPACACCVNKSCPMHHRAANQSGPGVSARGCASHCSSFLTVPQWAHTSSAGNVQIAPAFLLNPAALAVNNASKGCSNAPAVRGPPNYFLS